MSIAERLSEVRNRLLSAAKRAGRNPDEITLVAVSKKQPADAIWEAYAAGQRDFGENYAQELADKRQQLSNLTDIRWHFIGALQSNKAKLIVPGTVLVHAIDRLSAAEALARRNTSVQAVDALIEVNVGGEESKAGVPPEQVASLLSEIGGLAGVRAAGLMCIPPPTETPDGSRPFFHRLRALRDELQPRFPQLKLLSMGMTHDFEGAVQEGATHIRVGTAIFGPRPPRES